jgi:hypothetical protein
MAINVNTVYQTVLLILNKEQRGYMTPVEFNKIGTQTQLEIFETYFDSLNQQLRVPQANTDYADRVVNLDEKISIFKEFGNAQSISSSNVFNLPQQFSGASPVLGCTTVFASTGTTSSTNLAVAASINMTLVTPNTNIEVGMTVTGGGLPAGVTIATANVAGTIFTLSSAQTIGLNASLTYSGGVNYTIQTATADEISNGVVQVFGNGILLDKTQYTITGTVITFNSQPTIGQTLVVNVYPKQFYRLGQVLYQVGALNTEELQRIDRGELYHLLSSKLTQPTTVNPIYLYENNQITVYPTSINSGLSVSYIRKPLAPTWNFIVGGSSQYVYNASTSYDFELHSADQTELILKILLYAGVVIKDPEIIQVAASQVQQENINQQR